MSYKEQEYQIKCNRYERLKKLRTRITNEMSSLSEDMDQITDPLKYAKWIQKTVAEHFGVPVELLLNGSHDRTVTDPRHIAIKLIPDNTSLSTTSIALLFNKNHATVLHACKKVRNLCTVDKNYRMLFEQIKMEVEC